MQPEALGRLNRAMARLADGDRGAAEEVFALLWPELLRFARRALGGATPADADDAAQVAIEKVFARISEYDTTRSGLTWALAITSWECRTLLTARRRRARHVGTQVEGVEYIEQDVPTPEEATIMMQMREALRDVIEHLPPADRATLEQAFLEDAADPKSPTFRKRKARALERLRTAFRKFYGN